MSGPDSQRPDDHLLDEFLAGRSAVSKPYRAASDETAPPEMDAAVLRLALEAARRPPRLRRWRRPLAVAAVLVLSFGSLQLIREEPTARRATLMEPEAPGIAMPLPGAGSAAEHPAAAEAPKDEEPSASGSGPAEEPVAPQATVIGSGVSTTGLGGGAPST